MRRPSMSVALVMALVLGLPGMAIADTPGPWDPGEPVSDGMTLRIRAVTLDAKVLVTVYGTVRCDPKPTIDGQATTWAGLELRAVVQQATSKGIAHGSSWSWRDPARVCDGLAHRIVFRIAADPAGMPFKIGTAIVSVAGYARWEGCDEATQECVNGADEAATGWVVTRLRPH